jgi:hypothetical protein
LRKRRRILSPFGRDVLPLLPWSLIFSDNNNNKVETRSSNKTSLWERCASLDTCFEKGKKMTMPFCITHTQPPIVWNQNVVTKTENQVCAELLHGHRTVLDLCPVKVVS